MTTVSCNISGKPFSLTCGEVARQAHGAVWVTYGGTVVLVTAVSERKPAEGATDFVPLTVEYRERAYASGRIPGGFFKREGKPTTRETLVSRLTDRPLRPLFPKGYRCETQIIATVLSADRENDADVLSIVGASAALAISDIPFNGPIAAVRVGRINGEFVVNPTSAQIEESDMDIVVAGSRDAVIMVEGGAKIVPEEEMLEAIFFGHSALQPLLDIQEELVKTVGVPKRPYEPAPPTEGLKEKIWELAWEPYKSALNSPSKVARHRGMDEVREKVMATLAPDFPEKESEMFALFEDLERAILREGIIKNQMRVDGRGLKDIRQIDAKVSVLPQTHGSALFTRGETQALAVVTLGTRADEQKIEGLEGDWWKSFLMHYNFPPFSVGEVRNKLGPGRREIGHGNLAERALEKVIPPHEEFPYTIRAVSEILESNGSSSMASVCAGSMALMDAGIPVSAQVAGIAMGLVKEGDQFFILSDILGDEDHCGDMDFKVAGTWEGVTAFQMDVKIPGLTKEILRQALEQAREGRRFILEKMNAVIDKPREAMSPLAPRITTITIPVDKIKDVIGPGGKTIKNITEVTGATIEIEDDGTVLISSVNGEANEKAIQMIRDLTAEAEVGKYYKGKVRRITDFGAFVEILPGTDGLIHISQLDHHRVEKVSDVLREGDEVLVKCIGIDSDGKVSLSRKDALGRDIHGNPIEGYVPPPPKPRKYSDKKPGDSSGKDRDHRGGPWKGRR